MSDTRERLLEVTARIFAEAGYHGTTTRRIAQEAEINEVTLFRHFKTKEALIQQALSTAGVRNRPTLDPNAADPAEELHRWARAVFHYYYDHRNLIRRLMADMVERPEIAPTFCEDSNQEHAQLIRYLEKLKQEGAAAPDLHPEAAAGSLLGALFANALWRDYYDQLPAPDETVRLYVNFCLRAAGISAMRGTA
jgi:AcrR family transcriptional regulator